MYVCIYIISTVNRIKSEYINVTIVCVAIIVYIYNRVTITRYNIIIIKMISTISPQICKYSPFSYNNVPG